MTSKSFLPPITPIVSNNLNFKLIQSDINNIVKFVNERQLLLNSNKTFLLPFGSISFEHKFLLNDVLIAQVNEAKDLGVIIDRNMKFSAHCDYHCVTARALRIANISLDPSQQIPALSY